MAYARFVPLRVFSSYSMLESTLEADKLGRLAADRQFPALALCDRNGLYGAMPFSAGCAQAGVQPIIGTLLAVARPGCWADGVATNGRPPIDWLALLAQDEAGYENLCRLTSLAHIDRPIEQDAHVDMEMLASHQAGLICLTAGSEGALARLLADGQQERAHSYCESLKTIFADRLYIELVRTGDAVARAAEAALLRLAHDQGIALVATNPACFPDPGFHEAHDAMLCISEGSYVESAERTRSNPESWLKPADQMQQLFADVPEALANTLVVAQRCAVMAPKRKPILPTLADDPAAEEQQLRADAQAGLEARLARIPALSGVARAGYEERLAFELDVIAKMGFSGYFLIVADFIKWAKGQDIPVGPGRGSGAGSLVAWALTITDLDPIRLGLLFERFLNPDRVSMPDFDIDFCETRRGEVIRYVQERYGRDSVAQIITFGTLKARAALKDVGRVLQIGYGQLDRLAKLVPNVPTDPKTLDQALAEVPELMREVRSDPRIRKLFDLARQIEGLPRHSSTHAAGVVIGDRPLSELVPLYRDPRSDIPVTQFDMKYSEAAGLVKFDFLGLKTLSVLKEAQRLLGLQGIDIDMDALPLDDAETYALLQRGDTVGVFQFESEGMRRALAQIKPTNFSDIIAIGALFRPGPMDNIPLFADRKNGRVAIEYPHPMLQDILQETYGIIVYQEQVMQAAQVLAGYSLGEADLLRRAMGKKLKAEMDAQRARFVEGAGLNGIDEGQANALFDLIDKFSGYGFNKSHAAAYAVLSYQTAWLKTHHPQAFFAASMTYDMHATDKLSVFVDDMRRLAVTLLPPCINRSEADFTLERDGGGLAVRYALGGLKGVGEKAMEHLVAERAARGDFLSLDDLADRLDARSINRRQLEALIAGGALDCLNPRRAVIHAGTDMILATAAEAARQRESGQGGLFGGDVDKAPQIILPDVPEWREAEQLEHERAAFGFHFSGHPLDQFADLLAQNQARSHAQICESFTSGASRAPARMAALIEGVRWRTSQKGRRYMSVNLSDRSGQYEANCFDEQAAKWLDSLGSGQTCVLLDVEIDVPEGQDVPRIGIRGVTPLAELSNRQPVERLLFAADVAALREIAALIARKGSAHSAIIRICLLDRGHGVGELRLPGCYCLDAADWDRLNRFATLPDDELIAAE